MKALVCEMCHSNEVIKQEGYFVCQACGTKYSVEEAKKIMVEIDNSKKINNLYNRARKSLEVNDLASAAQYYKEILNENPDDWEAYFYSYLGETTSFTNAEAAVVATKLGNTIPTAYDMAMKDCSDSEIVNRIKTITRETSDRLAGIAATAEILLRQHEGGNTLFPTGKVNANLYQNLRPTVANTISSCVVALSVIAAKLEDVINSDTFFDKDACGESLLYVYRNLFKIANLTFEPTAVESERLIKAELIHRYAKKLHELDSSFDIPTLESVTNPKGGCYIATAVYGSYDCPEVWTLRRYRDYSLATKWYGRLFIKSYYSISPKIVKIFGRREWFKNIWKRRLDVIVNNLNAKGTDNTPYDDKN